MNTTTSQAAIFYTGTSGLLLPVPNKLLYPPGFRDKSRLAFYGSLYNSIEINSSFYKIPMISTVRRWAEEVPEDFRFTFKLWKGITHNKGLIFNDEDIHRFIEVIAGAGAKKGCLLVQFPASITSLYKTRFAQLLSVIRAADPHKAWSLAVEFRHSSWYKEEIYELLDGYRAFEVYQDMPKCVTPFRENDSDVVYLRFHGPSGNYRDSYTEYLLSEYAGYIRDWQSEGKTVYTYFNNTMGEALGNLEALREFVTEVF